MISREAVEKDCDIAALTAQVAKLQQVIVLASTVLAIPHPHPSAPGNLHDAGNCDECRTEERLRDALLALTSEPPGRTP